MSSKLSPRTLFIQDAIAKLPSDIKITKSSDASTTSPSLKRRRTSSSSYHSSPDIRRKVLEKSVDQKLATMLKDDLIDLTKSSQNLGSEDVSIINLDDSNDGEDSISLEEKENPPAPVPSLPLPPHPKKVKSNKSPKSKKSPKDKDKPHKFSKSSNKKSPLPAAAVDENHSNLLENLSQVSTKKTPSPRKLSLPQGETPKSSKRSPRTSTSSLTTPKIQAPCEWIEVTRTKRKRRIYLIEAKAEDEEFKAIHKAEENTKVPAYINGRKPFTIIQGIDYEIDEEVVGEDLDAKKDEEELKIIRNEQYMLDSFCCDAGYLSDEELNETPTVNKVVSKVKQQRRANNIKDKRKFEKLSDPVVIGPFFWSGKGGCKKELKKWQPMVFSESPIPTGLNTKIPEDQVQQEEDPCDSDEELVIKKPAPPSIPPPVEDPPQVSKVVGVVNYDEKYAIKYFIKNLVTLKMRSGPVNNNVSASNLPISSSTPMIKNVSNKVVTQEYLKSAVLQEGNDVMSINLEFVDKYVSKYYHKFK